MEDATLSSVDNGKEDNGADLNFRQIYIIYKISVQMIDRPVGMGSCGRGQ